MCKNPEVNPAVNSAKCAAVGALIAAILACLGFAVGGWPAGIGGILGIIASSMLLCCGPNKKAEGKGMHTASGVLYILAAILAVAGLALALAAYFNVLAAAQLTCATYQQQPSAEAAYQQQQPSAEAACVNLIIGFVGIFIWPAVALAAISAGMDVWGAVTAFKAMKAIQAEMSGGDGGIQFTATDKASGTNFAQA